MTDNNKTRRSVGLIAVIIGIIIGKKGLPVLMHIIYIVLIAITFMFAKYGPINSYFESLAKEKQIQTTINKDTSKEVKK